MDLPQKELSTLKGARGLQTCPALKPRFLRSPSLCVGLTRARYTWSEAETQRFPFHPPLGDCPPGGAQASLEFSVPPDTGFSYRAVASPLSGRHLRGVRSRRGPRLQVQQQHFQLTSCHFPNSPRPVPVLSGELVAIRKPSYPHCPSTLSPPILPGGAPSPTHPV